MIRYCDESDSMQCCFPSDLLRCMGWLVLVIACVEDVSNNAEEWYTPRDLVMRTKPSLMSASFSRKNAV